jgi:rubrerythrin
MTKTEEALAAAFAGESQANRKYLSYAQKADREGHAQVARLFRAASEAEAVHAQNHLRVMGAVKTTAENLKDAIAGETHEFKKMYPEMIEIAKAEGNPQAVRTFELANAVEETHAKLYSDLLESLGGKIESFPYFVCPVCGYTVGKEPPNVCPVCGAAGSAFKRID